jgi:hypothetical protein
MASGDPAALGGLGLRVEATFQGAPRYNGDPPTVILPHTTRATSY